MDPYSAEGELINIHNAFHQGQYQEVVDFDTSSLSPENKVAARVLVQRARVALGQAEDVLADVQDETDEPEFAAVAALAQSALGQTEDAVEAVEELARTAPDNQTVQVLGGIVLQAAGKSDEALALLSKHSGSREYTQPPWTYGRSFYGWEGKGSDLQELMENNVETWLTFRPGGSAQSTLSPSSYRSTSSRTGQTSP